jgi:ATP-dependent helicase/nuclease subunit A
MKSDFWQRIMKAEKRYFEIPFSIKTDSSVLLVGEWEEKGEKGAMAKKEKLPIILTGAIDLAFFEQDGWVIADYKTDEVGEGLEKFVKYYGSQVKLYSKYWEEITKQKVKEAGLYFTSLDKWVKIYPNKQI